MKINIRPENKNDYQDIKLVNDLAFEQETESILIDKLRKTEAFIPELSLVAEASGEILGHILFYPVMIEGPGGTIQTLALAPMSVMPEFQGLGIGSKLVGKGLGLAAQMGFKHVNVLGHPGYYPRFGFEPASKWKIDCPFEGVPDHAFMMLELVKGSLDGVSGVLNYPDFYKGAV